ncbi:hypothetical protein CAPTEDRAFT_200521 [Capitella teleta]|uniref:diaminopimelate epimerase n=1 Tax=Capitella teleta TaxID=283909 RepID=R7U9Z9_CAPTE|nr:hypothetical protein CAPTEDRAFT_200521 [Capitella teleta]|eukprot:ELT99955.1 hypothetical protein CAPTEDRAFT_200521 [Capitella teleta]
MASTHSRIISFHKYQGAGNDFILLDNTKGGYAFICSSPEYIREICHRRFGVGADGLIAISKPAAGCYDFRMTYYNCDGFEGSMCGNGARCAVSFARQLGLLQYNEARFLAYDGVHFAIYDELHANVHVKMNIDGKITKLDETSYFVDTGSPHVVRFVAEGLDELNVEVLGRQICDSGAFPSTSGGVNVNFVQLDQDDGLQIRTYERGVGAETYACGTGSVAAALVHAHRASSTVAMTMCNRCVWNARHTHVKVKGGELSVAFDWNAEQGFSEVYLVGPAQYVYSGTYTCKDR